MRLKHGKRGSAVRVINEDIRARLDFWAVQWHPSRDGLFRPQWWSVRTRRKPVAELSPPIPSAKPGTRTVRVLLAYGDGTEEIADLTDRG